MEIKRYRDCPRSPRSLWVFFAMRPECHIVVEAIGPNPFRFFCTMRSKALQVFLHDDLRGTTLYCRWGYCPCTDWKALVAVSDGEAKAARRKREAKVRSEGEKREREREREATARSASEERKRGAKAKEAKVKKIENCRGDALRCSLKELEQL